MGGPFAERVNVRNKEIEMTSAMSRGGRVDYFQMGVTTLAEGRYFTADEEARRGRSRLSGSTLRTLCFRFRMLSIGHPDRRPRIRIVGC